MPQGSEIDTNAHRRKIDELAAKRKLGTFTDNLDKYFGHAGSLHWVEYTCTVLKEKGKPVSPQTVTIEFCKKTCARVKDRVSSAQDKDIIEDYVKGFERILGIVEKLVEDPYLRETLGGSNELVENLYMAVGVEAIADHNQKGTTARGFVEEGENRYAVLEGAKKARVMYSTYLPVAKVSFHQAQPKTGS